MAKSEQTATSEFRLPEIGEGVHEGEIVRWLVKPGDSVKEDQALVEIMTDKATVEVPTSVGGTILELLAEEGSIIKVGQVIAKLGGGEASAPAPKEAAPEKTAPAPQPKAAALQAQTAKAAPEAEGQDDGGESSVGADPSEGKDADQTEKPRAPAAAAPSRPAPAPQMERHAPQAMLAGSADYQTATAGNVLASPATRRLARELQVPLERITGSGPSGRVTRDDVQRTASAGMGATAAGPQRIATTAPRSTTTAQSTAVSAPAQRPATQSAPAVRSVPSELETLVPFRGMRRKISEGMRLSKDKAAHFTYVDECDVSELVKFRAEAKKMAEEQGVKLTYLPFLIKAAVQALRKFPMLNSSLDEQGGNIIVKNYYNIGIAMDTADGLIVPVVKDCANKSILQIAQEIHTLSEKAQTKRLAMEDLKGGTFTITNAGTIGGLFATPIINFPEVAILGFNKIARRPHVRKDAQGEEELYIADMTWFSISIDHRIVDGATGARFMNEFMGLLANPKRLILDMI